MDAFKSSHANQARGTAHKRQERSSPHNLRPRSGESSKTSKTTSPAKNEQLLTFSRWKVEDFDINENDLLSALPNEMKMSIAYHLEFHDLFKLRLANRCLCTAIDDKLVFTAKENYNSMIFEDLKKRSQNTNKGKTSMLNADYFSVSNSYYMPPREAFVEGPACLTRSTWFNPIYFNASYFFILDLYTLAANDNNYVRKVCVMAISLHNSYSLPYLCRAANIGSAFLDTAEIIRESSISEKLTKLNHLKKSVVKYLPSDEQLLAINLELNNLSDYGKKAYLITDEAWELAVENKLKI